MKALFGIILIPFLLGCMSTPRTTNEKFEVAPNRIDQSIGSATIEDYILALPPFAFHEESVDQFAVRVRQARLSEKENVGKNQDYLFVSGDGSAPSKEFLLDRRLRVVTIRSFNWEPGTTDDSITMRRVSGGWMRGPRVAIKTADQAAASRRR